MDSVTPQDERAAEDEMALLRASNTHLEQRVQTLERDLSAALERLNPLRSALASLLQTELTPEQRALIGDALDA